MARNFKLYYELKEKHPDAMLLFRCGDFYELYREDAKNASDVLGLTITCDINDGVMCGFPHHALDTYMPKLIRAGYRLAICDQLDDYHKKHLPKRGINELPTPAPSPRPRANSTIELPKLTEKQHDLLCECIRYRVADNQKERNDALRRNLSPKWYDDMEKRLEELKDLIYDIN